jgi:hypothetical protein
MAPDVGEVADTIEKFKAIFEPIDAANLEEHFEQGFIDSELLLNRISMFLDRRERIYDGTPLEGELQSFDYESLYSDLEKWHDRVSRQIESAGPIPKDMELIMLQMFRMGYECSAIDHQDLIQSGHKYNREKGAGDIRRRESVKSVASARCDAYISALLSAEAAGYKPTKGGLTAFLKAQAGQSFDTGVQGCEAIWFAASTAPGTDIYDSVGAPAPTSGRSISNFVSKLKESRR